MLSGHGVSRRRCYSPWNTCIRTIWLDWTLQWGIQQLPPLCKGCIRDWCLSSIIIILAVWSISPVANVWPKARNNWMLDAASSMMKRHFNCAGMSPAVDLNWLSGLVPIQRSTVSFLGGLCFLHLLDPEQWTIWTACLSHWQDVTGIAIVLYRMYFASLRVLKYWSWST